MALALKWSDGQWIDCRPVKTAFNQFRSQTRATMCILAWPRPKTKQQKTFFELAIENDVDDAGRADNTPKGLEDLSAARYKLLSDFSYGNKFNRAGSNKVANAQRIKRMTEVLADLKKHDFDESSEVYQAQQRTIRQFRNGSLDRLRRRGGFAEPRG